MLWITAALCVFAWVLGLVTTVTLSGFLHVLPLAAVLLGYVAVTRTRAENDQRRIAARHQDEQFGGRKSYRIGGAP